MPSASIRLLGPFSLRERDQLIELDQIRLQEFVAYLALHGEDPLPRQQVAFTFWPDTSEAQARTNLRNLLYKLRKAWPRSVEILRMDRAQIGWDPAADLDIDQRQFERLLDAVAPASKDRGFAGAGAAADPEAMEEKLRQAITLYRGDLLVHSYEDWVLAARERLRNRYLHALQQLATSLCDRRKYDEALAQAETLLQYDPLRESSYRLLMQIHAARNDRAAALRVYHTCASTLEHELGVEPSAATKTIYNRLLNLTETPSQQPVDVQSRIPLVGRRRAWQQMAESWRRARAGRALFVIVRGEAGIGKTRLAEELFDVVTRQGVAAASTRSYAAAGAPAYAPLTEWLRQEPLCNAATTLPDLWRVELARLLPELLADRPELPPPGPLRESWQQQRFYEAAAQVLLTAPHPLLLHIDDLQWCDAETLTVLGFLLHRLQTLPLLVVGTVRSDELDGDHPLRTLLPHLRRSDQLHEIDLGPLNANETAALATHTAGTALPATELDRLYRESEGHPLFLIETVRMGKGEEVSEESAQNGTRARIDSGRPFAVDGVSIPPRIRSVISARLNQLSPPARSLAELAAVVGRNFTFSVLHAASPEDEETLVMALDELWQRRLVREQGTDAYDFSHDRIREVTYAGIGNPRRRLLHRRVAEGLAAVHTHDREPVAGQLAVHYEAAGQRREAAHYYQRAGDLAVKQHALREAEHLYRRALAATDETDLQTRLHLLLTLDKVVSSLGNQKVRSQNLRLIEEIAEQLPPNESNLHARILLRRASYQRDCGLYHEALRLAQEGAQRAQDDADPALVAHAYFQWGMAHWSLTDMKQARTLLQSAAEYARRAREFELEETALEFTAATGMFSGMPAGEIMELLQTCMALTRQLNHRIREANLYNKFGYLPVEQGEGGLDAAEEHYLHALRIAQETGDRHLAANVWSNMVVLYTHVGDYRRAHEAARESLALSTEAGHHLRTAATLNYRGKAFLQQGELAAARRDMETSLRMFQESKNHHFQVKTRSDLGLLYHVVGDHDAAQLLLHETLHMVQGYGDTRFEAHAHTRLGYALEALHQWDEAEEAYATAERLHRRMEQINYSMNAAAGLARIAWQRGEREDAAVRACTIWDHLDGRSLDATIETARLYRTCFQLLRQADPDRAAAIAETARRQLQKRASTIDDADQRALFWQIPDHRFFATDAPEAAAPTRTLSSTTI